MIIKTEQDLTCQDIEVLIRYAKKNKCVQKILAFIQLMDTQIKCKNGNSDLFIDVSDVFYIESVDKRTFVYLEKSVLRTEFRLYQLMEELSHVGFLQISKSCILNIHALESVKTLSNSRMEATLKNGERLCITRKYLSGIKQALQGGLE